jgi:hypothetical protein
MKRRTVGPRAPGGALGFDVMERTPMAPTFWAETANVSVDPFVDPVTNAVVPCAVQDDGATPLR